MRLNRLFAGTAIACALALTACGGGGGGGDDTLTLRRGISAKVDTLDPHRSSAAWENIVIGDMFLGLTQHTADGQVIPAMAESWTTSDDGLVWTFTLRDTTWSDGTPMTADDFVFALRRIQDPAIASQYSSLLYIIKNAQPLNEGRIEPEELGVRAVDDRTLEITLEEPAPYLLGLLTHYTTFPVPKHIVEQYGEAWVQPE
ncbi:MAG: ABC transporter substrate-binding protein, partial [Pseudomonadota bacterium]|nr:ABC transporter substrate-binding protein [Pseudomonadota bacterium]